MKQLTTENTKTKNETAGSHGLGSSVPLESILITEELQRRPSRPPDYEKESRALVALAEALSTSPRTVLQTLAETILAVCRAGSAGISLLTKEDGGKRFYWPAIAGEWKQHIGGGTPRDFGPCGDVLDRNAPLLMRQVQRRYTYFEPVTPSVQEALLVPFYVQGTAAGTIWAVAHDDRKFDAEDERLMKSLGKFASSAYQTLESLDASMAQAAEALMSEQALRESEERMRAQAAGLELQVRERTRELEQRNFEILQQAERLRELSRRLLQTQDDERRRIARDLHDSVGPVVTVLGMYLASITQRAMKPEVRKAAQESHEMVRQLSQEIRTISYLLHPPLLDENGLPGAIRWYTKGLSERSGLQFQLDIPADFERLPGDLEVAIFRIVQECLTNIHRHSGGKTATIRLTRNLSAISLEIRDDGSGIAKDTLTAIRTQRSGVGMTGMRERVRNLGGNFDVQSDSSGTIVSVVLPLVANPPADRAANAAT